MRLPTSNKEEDVESDQLDRVEGDEVCGQDQVCVLAHELAPGGLASPGCWLLSTAAEQSAPLVRGIRFHPDTLG